MKRLLPEGGREEFIKGRKKAKKQDKGGKNYTV